MSDLDFTKTIPLNKHQCIYLAGTCWWHDLKDEEIIAVQIHQPKSIMPFNEYHGLVNKLIDPGITQLTFAFLTDMLKADFARRYPELYPLTIITDIYARHKTVLDILGDIPDDV